MSNLQLKLKRLSPQAVVPSKAYPSDTAFDLTAVSRRVSDDYRFVEYEIGWAIQPPPGWATQIRARSSISKYDLLLCNGVGTADRSYTGPIILRFKIVPSWMAYPEANSKNILVELDELDVYKAKIYEVGDKIGQLALERVPEVELVEVESLDPTDRGTGGFGSTGS